MALRPVAQLHHSGCFIASVAMLLGKSYDDAFHLLHPGQKTWMLPEHGFLEASVEEAAHRHLRSLGFKTRSSRYRKFKSFTERMNKNAILIVRWAKEPDLCHCIVFDGENKNFIEPDGGYIIRSKYILKRLQKQLDCSIVIDKTPSHCWIRDSR